MCGTPYVLPVLQQENKQTSKQHILKSVRCSEQEGWMGWGREGGNGGELTNKQEHNVG